MLLRTIERQIEWVEMHYTDVVGRLRSTSVPYGDSERPLVARVDGSSIGISDISDSDAVLVADVSTLSHIPWSSGWGRVVCDIYRDVKSRHPVDSRLVTQKLEEHLKGSGVEALVGVELEFFIFKSLKAAFIPPVSAGYRIELVDRAGARLLSNYQVASDSLRSYRAELVDTLSKFFSVKVSGHHHEVASSQLEINIDAGNPTKIADSIQTVKYVAKSLAELRRFKAVFMPKPLCYENGSGMHVHVSLWRGPRNLFYDDSDRNGLSQTARYFIGGLLYHIRALAALVAPTVNSYRRLVPGFESPVYSVWGYRNRSAAVRVPLVYGEKHARVEFRPPDPTANPYLAIAAIVMAGLDGIKKSIDPGNPLNESAYELPRVPKERRLPSSLTEALSELLSDSDFLKPVFTDELLKRYVEAKEKEAIEVIAAPSPIEFLKYHDF
ncbi:MAG: glutamine synthetase beta-grasp domain-containing protein [Sulfolobales archaeon]